MDNLNADNADSSIEVNNMESLLESLEAEHEKPYHNCFLDLHEQEFIDEETYRSLGFDNNGYVANLIDGFF